MIKVKIEEFKDLKPKDPFDIGTLHIAEDKTVVMVIGYIGKNTKSFNSIVIYTTDKVKKEDGLYEGDKLVSCKDNYIPFYGRIIIESTNE